jgi:hypothetical protein
MPEYICHKCNSGYGMGGSKGEMIGRFLFPDGKCRECGSNMEISE